MKSTLIVSLTSLLYLVLGSLGSVYGSTRSTSLGSVAQALANTFTAYADDHQGNPPESWEELRPYADIQRLERHLGSSLDAKIILFTGIRPTLADDAEGNLIAMTAFPISEDRHGQLGRYIIYRRSFGKYAARWQNEDTIQRALGKAGRVVPPAPIFYEKLFKPLELEYSRPPF